MATKAKRLCKYPLCPMLVSVGYCEAHEKKTVSRQRQQYDAERRPEDSRLYDKRQWRDRLQPMKLAADPFCQVEGCDELATDVDHAIPIEDRPDLMFDMSNLQSLCHSHHSEKTAKENRAKGKW